MDPFRALSLLELEKEERISSLAVFSSGVFLGTERGLLLSCQVSFPSEEEEEAEVA